MSQQSVPLKEQGPSRPDVFSFHDYRQFLDQFYRWKKYIDPRFTYRIFSRKAGVCGSYFRMLVMGQRNLPESKINQFAKACDLNSWEEKYFVTLVLWNQSKNEALRQEYWERLVKLAPCDSFRYVEAKEENILDHWYVLGLLEMMNLPDFKLDAHWISERFVSPITPEDVQQVIQKLLRFGLIEIVDGKARPKVENVMACTSHISRETLKQYHEQNIPKGAEAVRLVESQLRRILSASFPLSIKSINRICDRLEEFRNEILEEAAHETLPDEVYQLNIQLFPLTKKGTCT